MVFIDDVLALKMQTTTTLEKFCDHVGGGGFDRPCLVYLSF
jgi:hypothetical protein